jgi:glycerol-3-phosphate acyltransferase PlsY
MLLWLIAGYLIGSISSAVIVCRLIGGGDPRQQGSGNPGATNVLRLQGKFAAVAVLLGDVIKGIVPVIGAQFYGLDPSWLITIGFVAFLGHLYPIFFKFRGGKGVATFLGVMLALNWRLGAILVSIWLMTACVVKYSSVAAIVMAIMAPFLVAHFLPNLLCTLMTVVMSVLLLIRHRSNIRNLLLQNEPSLTVK